MGKSWHDAKAGLKNETSGDENRPSAAKRGYDRQWRNKRLALMKAKGIPKGSKVALDHKEAHKGDSEKFSDPDNLEFVPIRHHNRKAGTGR